MKMHILFDSKTGRVISLMQAPVQRPAAAQPVVGLRPRPGQDVATFDIPAKLRDFSPGQLHAAVQIDLSGPSPRLVPRR